MTPGGQRHQGPRVCRGEGSATWRPALVLDVVAGLSPDAQACRSMWGEWEASAPSHRCSVAPSLSGQPPNSIAQHPRLCVASSHLPFWLHSPVLCFLSRLLPAPGHQALPGHFHLRAFAPAAPSSWTAFPSHVHMSKTSRPAPVSAPPGSLSDLA